MTTNENFLLDLLCNVESGKHRQFQFLRNWHEYRNTKKIRRAHTLLVGSLRQSLRAQLKRYCKAVKAGETEIINLLAYTTTQNVLNFYEEELSILEDMLDEYEWYLFYGNWVDFILGVDRPADKLYDHRSTIWKNTL
jgi:hypothetical protein